MTRQKQGWRAVGTSAHFVGLQGGARPCSWGPCSALPIKAGTVEEFVRFPCTKGKTVQPDAHPRFQELASGQSGYRDRGVSLKEAF